MSTTRETISAWFDEGIRHGGLTHMVIICDTYDNADHPLYFDSADAARAKTVHMDTMNKAMEVYDLRADKAAQLAESRAWNFGDLPPGYTEARATQRVTDADIRTAREMLGGPPSRINYAALCDLMQVDPWTAPEPEMGMGYLGEKAGTLSTKGAEPYPLRPRDQGSADYAQAVEDLKAATETVRKPLAVGFTYGGERLRIVIPSGATPVAEVNRGCNAMGVETWNEFNFKSIVLDSIVPLVDLAIEIPGIIAAVIDAVGWTKPSEAAAPSPAWRPLEDLDDTHRDLRMLVRYEHEGTPTTCRYIGSADGGGWQFLDPTIDDPWVIDQTGWEFQVMTP